jgi:hypothetical protein
MTFSPMPSDQDRESALFALALERPITDRAAFLQGILLWRAPAREEIAAAEAREITRNRQR